MVPLAFLRLREQSLPYTYVTAGKLVLQLSLNIVFLAGLGLGVKGVFISALLATTVTGVGLGIYLVRCVGFRFSSDSARSLLRYGVPLIGMHIATFIATFGDRYFLRTSSDVTAVGLYSLAYQFGFILSALGFGPFAMMWEPMRFAVAKRPDKDEVYARAFIYMNLLLLSTALGITLFVGDVIRVMSAPAFHRAADSI